MAEPLHYELVLDDQITQSDKTLTRIRATKDLPDLGVAAGDLGGYVESPQNLSGDAWVFGSARVSGNAEVSGNADWLIVGPAKSSGRFTTAHRTAAGVQVNCGCFSGTPRQFLAAIEETHRDSLECLAQYRAFHALIVANFS